MNDYSKYNLMLVAKDISNDFIKEILSDSTDLDIYDNWGYEFSQERLFDIKQSDKSISEDLSEIFKKLDNFYCGFTNAVYRGLMNDKCFNAKEGFLIYDNGYAEALDSVSKEVVDYLIDCGLRIHASKEKDLVGYGSILSASAECKLNAHVNFCCKEFNRNNIELPKALDKINTYLKGLHDDFQKIYADDDLSQINLMHGGIADSEIIENFDIFTMQDDIHPIDIYLNISDLFKPSISVLVDNRELSTTKFSNMKELNAFLDENLNYEELRCYGIDCFKNDMNIGTIGGNGAR